MAFRTSSSGRRSNTNQDMEKDVCEEAFGYAAPGRARVWFRAMRYTGSTFERLHSPSGHFGVDRHLFAAVRSTVLMVYWAICVTLL